MVRPCFLVLDPEHPGSISTRKLVIETAKFNVVTAYSGLEALETFAKYPAVDGVVLDARVLDVDAADLIERLRKHRRGIQVIVIDAPGTKPPANADFVVDSLDPAALLGVLRRICPDETEAIRQHDRELEAEEGLS